MLRMQFARRVLPALLLLVFGLTAGPAVAADLDGNWTTSAGGNDYLLIFDGNGGLSVIENNEAVVVGSYEVDGSDVTIVDLGGAKACKGDAAEATYGFEKASGAVTFTKVSDSCQSRAAILDGTTFQSGG